MSRLRAGQLFGISIAGLVAVAVVGFVAGLLALDSLGENRRAVVDRIDPALFATQRFLGAMTDQESGVRGFSLAGDAEFLQPYTDGVPRAKAALADLRRLAGAESAAPIAAAAAAWQEDFAAPTVAAVRSGRTTFTEAEVQGGKTRFDKLRAAVAALETELATRRQEARDGLTTSATRVRVVVIAFAATILVSLLAAAAVLRRAIIAPLGRLAGQVRAVTEGDLGASIEAGGAREVVSLGGDVETMRARIVAERDELERSNTELEQFAYVASHDLQEPLRKVASFTQMLQRRYEGQLDERADQYIGFAIDGAKRMQELINDLLAFSRVGRLTEPWVEVDLNAVVRHALPETDGRIDVDDLPTVSGEPNLLEVVFANLLSNAVKFRSDVPLAVRLEVERKGEEWEFAVIDNGIGIDAEYADRIFVIFQRLHPRSAYEGTGIGLALSRKIIEYHGGTIWFEVDHRPGACFRFTLPAI